MCHLNHDQLHTRNRSQVEEATTGFNRWVTGVELRCDPTDEQCLTHWAEHKGFDDWRSRHDG
jgi:hypothetical protein